MRRIPLIMLACLLVPACTTAHTEDPASFGSTVTAYEYKSSSPGIESSAHPPHASGTSRDRILLEVWFVEMKDDTIPPRSWRARGSTEKFLATDLYDDEARSDLSRNIQQSDAVLLSHLKTTSALSQSVDMAWVDGSANQSCSLLFLAQEGGKGSIVLEMSAVVHSADGDITKKSEFLGNWSGSALLQYRRTNGRRVVV